MHFDPCLQIGPEKRDLQQKVVEAAKEMQKSLLVLVAGKDTSKQYMCVDEETLQLLKVIKNSSEKIMNKIDNSSEV